MSYTYERFGSITLPTYNREASIAPAAAQLRIVATAAGAFDADGSGRSAQQFPHALTLEAIVSEDATADQRDALDELRAAVGTRANLYRVADDDGTVHRAACRLQSMTAERSYEQRRAYQPVRLIFQQLEAWRGASTGWTLDDGELLDDGLMLDETAYTATITASPSAQTITNGGNLPVTDAVITITAGSGNLVNPVLTGGGMDLRWTGTINAGDALVIDCGALSVQDDGVDAYSGFARGSGHTVEDWCYLAPGATALSLAVSGTLTGASWSVSFRERWA